MEKKQIRVKVLLLEEMLGMCAAPDVHEKYIASKGPDASTLAEEIEALGEADVIKEKRTYFPRASDGSPIMWDYQMKGMFKDSCGMLRRVKGSHSSEITSYKKVIDGNIFVGPRQIKIDIHGGEMSNCQRPLRADTAQGPRIALADSETVPAGSTLEFTITILEPPAKKGKPSLEECVAEWLEYGELRGMGQWRNSGKGIFTFEIVQ